MLSNSVRLQLWFKFKIHCIVIYQEWLRPIRKPKSFKVLFPFSDILHIDFQYLSLIFVSKNDLSSELSYDSEFRNHQLLFWIIFSLIISTPSIIYSYNQHLKSQVNHVLPQHYPFEKTFLSIFQFDFYLVSNINNVFMSFLFLYFYIIYIYNCFKSTSWPFGQSPCPSYSMSILSPTDFLLIEGKYIPHQMLEVYLYQYHYPNNYWWLS